MYHPIMTIHPMMITTVQVAVFVRMIIQAQTVLHRILAGVMGVVIKSKMAENNTAIHFIVPKNQTLNRFYYLA